MIPNFKLREKLGIIPQDIVLFNDTIFNNIHYGNLKASKRFVKDAAQKAEILSFINSLPKKFNTIVGERGLKLSGGEKQRIAIARAILKNPEIILLDEASSSLDFKTEIAIKKNLEEFSKNKTVIAVAHRLSSTKNHDIIYFIDKGRILEKGTHKELLNMRGSYFSMWESQKKNKFT